MSEASGPLSGLRILELADEKGDPLARVLLEPERGGLSASQVAWVDKLKAQIAALR